MIWHKLSEKKPIAFISGNFDGLKSEKVLVCTRSGRYYVAEMCEGILDGSKFCDFYDDRDFLIDYVLYWTEIDSPM